MLLKMRSIHKSVLMIKYNLYKNHAHIINKCILFLTCLYIVGIFSSASESAEKHTREEALRFLKTANTVFAPLYAPLAEQIVNDFNLTDNKGIGIDLGSGPGNLIIELCKRTGKMQWINADINPHFFPFFSKAADEAGVKNRVSAHYADAQNLPFKENYADIIVSRGSFHLWEDKPRAFSEIYRVLKPGGTAFIGRGFSENLPVEIARKIRNGKGEGGELPVYDIGNTAVELQEIMQTLKIKDYHIRIPKPPGSEGVNYGIWIEFHKPISSSSQSTKFHMDSSETPGREKNAYVMSSVEVIDTRLHDVVAEPELESVGLEPSITVINKSDMIKQGAKTLVDALEYVPGAWVETRGRKVKQFFSIRGQTYPYPEYAVDGAWQREFHELPYFFSSSDIERIEVVRSSAALLTGLSGLTGIINIIPKKYKEPESSGEIEYGTYNTYRVHLSHGATRGKIGYAFSVQPGHTDGPERKNAIEGMTNFRGSLYWYPTQKLEMQTNLFYLNGARELARAVPPADLKLQTTLEKYDPFRAVLFNFKTRYRSGEKASSEIIMNFADRDHTFLSRSDADPRGSSYRERDYEWSMNFIQSLSLSRKNVLRFGGLYNHWIAPEGKRFYTGKRCDLETYSAVVVDEHRFGPVVADAGLRWAKTFINEYGAFSINETTTPFKNVPPIIDKWQPSIFNASAGAAYYLSKNLSLHFNTASGFIQPDRGTLDINLNEPRTEKRFKLDIGIRPVHEKIGQLSVVAFFVRQKDAIVLSGQIKTLNSRIMELYLNRDQYQIGTELEILSPKYFNTIIFFTNLMAMKSKAELEGTMKRNKELPRCIIGGGVNVFRSKFDFNIFWKYVSSYESTRFVAVVKGKPTLPQPLGDFIALNGTAGWSIGEKHLTRVYLEIMNITDRKFSSVVGYPDYGRRFTVGVKQTFR